jgi:hypothetical protein
VEAVQRPASAGLDQVERRDPRRVERARADGVCLDGGGGMTHACYMDQLKAIASASLTPEQTLACQAALSFAKYLASFPKVETTAARMLLMDFLRKHNVEIVIDGGAA